jgi:predicted transcriptional regulator
LCIKVDAQLTEVKIEELQTLLKEFKDMFAWSNKEFENIPLELAQRIIELDTSIPPTLQVRYRLNNNYVAVIK